MNKPGSIIDAALNSAPLALVLLNDDDVIIELNRKAIEMGLMPQTGFASYIPDLGEKFLDHARHQPESQLYRLEFVHGEKRCRISVDESEGRRLVWLIDVSEQLALADQIRRLKQPGLKKIRQISQLAVTAAGYSELLEVILDDTSSLSEDKLEAVRQYQRELTKNLNAMQQVAGNTKPDRLKGSVLVADQNNALTELISELLRAEGYKVVGFSDPNTALKYYRVNEHNIHKAVVDEDLMCENNTSLVASLKSASPQLRLVVLSDDSDSGQGKVLKPLDFEVLLEAMEE